ncbi:DUF948 domain-containing protein [Paenibacillus sp. GCM10027627]|uniref:DUF948 domain-containing protein n=1 Tax=unclassified Paenibacillus TaxID=185978 RepID=UPI0036427E46
MEWLIGICIVAVTLAIIVLFYKLFKMLKLMGTAIEDAKRTMSELRSEMREMTSEARRVVQNTNDIALDAQKKMKELDTLFHTVKEIGSAAHTLTQSVRQAAAGAAARIKSGSLQAARKEEAGVPGAGVAGAIADGIASSIRIWNRLKQN